jgi:hypothetical protein
MRTSTLNLVEGRVGMLDIGIHTTDLILVGGNLRAATPEFMPPLKKSLFINNSCVFKQKYNIGQRSAVILG